MHVAKSSLLRIVIVPHFCGTLNVFQPQKGAGCNKLWKVAENYKLPQIRGGWLAGNSIKPLKELYLSLAWALHFFFSEIKKNKLKHENSNRYQKKLLKTAEIYHVTLSKPRQKKRNWEDDWRKLADFPHVFEEKNLISWKLCQAVVHKLHICTTSNNVIPSEKVPEVVLISSCER